MRKAIEQLGIRPGEGFDILVDAAWQFHKLRKGDLRVSRRTLLYAAMRVQPLVRAVLESCGFRIRKFEEKLGLPHGVELRKPKKLVEDFEVADETMRSALHWYFERYASRPLDPLGIAAGIVGSASMLTAEALDATNVDRDLVAKRFERYLGVSEGPWIRPTVQTSGYVREILAKAATPWPTTTSALMVATLQRNTASKGTGSWFLRSYVEETVGPEKLYQALETWMRWYDDWKGDFPPGEFWTQPLCAIFERASTIAREASHSSEFISGRHLVGAIIATACHEGIGSSDLLEKLGIDSVAVSRAYFDHLMKYAPPERSDNMTAWRRFLGVRDDVRTPRYNAEHAQGEDWLQIGPQVNAFATLIASKRITPPLSIGLFGDWGSGKSFFMAKLREEINDRATRGAKDLVNSPYYSRIVQIDFNAWHYVESNLWASLVEHVFSNLKLTTGETEETIKQRRQKLAAKIDSLIADRSAAEEKLQKEEIARDQAVQNLDAKKKLADATAAGLGGLRSRDVWELVEISDADRATLKTHLERFGVNAALRSKDEVRKTVDDVRQTKTRAALLGNWLLRQPRPLALLAVLVVLTPLAIAALLSLDPGWLDPVVKQITTLLAPCGAALAWLTQRLASANKVLEKLDDARNAIDAKVQAAENERQKELESDDKMVRDAVAAVEAAKGEVETKEQAVATAKQELLELSAGRRLARFIDTRASSNDYRQHLGVLAAVRHDFSMLSQLMYPADEDEEPELEDAYHIDRIVLFIDDLDRCEPDQVVKVLQAVHLLLAFKLFVVVVGVDARWVHESLRQKHQALRGDDDDEAEYHVAPHDYLEKIFQVPFWLEPLEPTTTASYISKLLADDVAEDETAHMKHDDNRSDEAKRIEIERQLDQILETNGVQRRNGRPEEDNPRLLSITTDELTFMQSDAIVKLVGRSPRTAKRYVNTYRFFRASLAEEELEEYLTSSPARYEIVLTLLAIVVGAPDVSLEAFAEIKEGVSANGTLEAFVNRVINRGDEWARVADALAALGRNQASLGMIASRIDDVARYSFRPPYAQLAKKKSGRTPKTSVIEGPSRGTAYASVIDRQTNDPTYVPAQ